MALMLRKVSRTIHDRYVSQKGREWHSFRCGRRRRRRVPGYSVRHYLIVLQSLNYSSSMNPAADSLRQLERPKKGTGTVPVPFFGPDPGSPGGRRDGPWRMPEPTRQ